ncbi:SAM-dependent methyltransferase, partial [Salmonella enterica subsp. enterica serovar Agona]|nr:SAM-dependent methyltransferase [Salmonella enterica subsp. enterica serovar Agona]
MVPGVTSFAAIAARAKMPLAIEQQSLAVISCTAPEAEIAQALLAIISTDYAVSKAFYCDILGFDLLSEVLREERDSWEGDFALNG